MLRSRQRRDTVPTPGHGTNQRDARQRYWTWRLDLGRPRTVLSRSKMPTRTLRTRGRATGRVGAWSYCDEDQALCVRARLPWRHVISEVESELRASAFRSWLDVADVAQVFGWRASGEAVSLTGPLNGPHRGRRLCAARQDRTGYRHNPSSPRPPAGRSRSARSRPRRNPGRRLPLPAARPARCRDEGRDPRGGRARRAEDLMPRRLEPCAPRPSLLIVRA